VSNHSRHKGVTGQIRLGKKGLKAEKGKRLTTVTMTPSLFSPTMKLISTKLLLAGFAVATFATAFANAAVIVTLPTATVAGKIQFTNDITFIVTPSPVPLPSNVSLLVFDEWVTSDGGQTSLNAPFSPMALSYTLNGVGGTINLQSIVDNASSGSAGGPSQNDGYLNFGAGITVSANDVLIIKAATYTIPAGTVASGINSFNPQAQQTFTGNAFLFDGVLANRLSVDTPVGAVPEPSGSLLLLGGLGLIISRRSRAV
jgi:hypothetical protein